MSGYDLPIQDDNEREWYANLGRIQEQERIIKLWEQEMDCKCEDAMNHLATLIKGEK